MATNHLIPRLLSIVNLSTASNTPDTETETDADASSDDEDMEIGSVVKGQTNKNYEIVGFIVAEVVVRAAQRYDPSLIPPLKKPSIMLPDDKPGFITDTTHVDGKLVFIVGFKDRKGLRIAVPVRCVGDYVSSWELERWDIEQENIREGEREALRAEEELLNPTPKLVKVVAAKPSTGRGRGRPKRKRSEEVETEAKVEKTVKGSRNISPVGPPFKKRHLSPESNPESGFDDEDTALQLQRQLIGSAQSTRDASLAKSKSPTPVRSSKKATLPGMKPGRSSERNTRSTSSSQVPPETGFKRRRDSVAMSSSLEAGTIYENLEKNKNSKLANSAIDSSTFYTRTEFKAETPYSKLGSIQKPKAEKPKAAASPVDEDEEFEVDSILDEQLRKSKNGRKVKYYLIKWVGDWDNSWEPKANIGADIIAAYEAGLKAKEKNMIGNGANGNKNKDNDTNGNNTNDKDARRVDHDEERSERGKNGGELPDIQGKKYESLGVPKIGKKVGFVESLSSPSGSEDGDDD